MINFIRIAVKIVFTLKLNSKKQVLNKKKMPKPMKNSVYRKNYNAESMKAAVECVKNGELSFRAAKRYGVPYSTLKDQVQRSEKGQLVKLGASTHFTPEEEAEIVDWINNCQVLGYPRTWRQIRLAARTLCTNNHGEVCKYYGVTPSSSWLDGFRSRYPDLKTRKSEKLEKASANVTKLNLQGWFTNVYTYFVNKKQTEILKDPRRVFGGDETSFQLGQGSKPVVVEAGVKNVYDVVASGGHENATVF